MLRMKNTFGFIGFVLNLMNQIINHLVCHDAMLATVDYLILKSLGF